MSELILISILVPAYNAAKTIERCLESILVQGTNNYEVVVINDGSTDDTYNILNKYAEKKQFKVIHQENHGVSYTRQQLIRNANGKYVLFCDADDYFEPNAIETIADSIINHNISSNQNKVDLYIFGYNLVRMSGKKSVQLRRFDKGLYTRNQFAKGHVAGFNDLYYSALWNKCFRRELIFSPNEIVFENLIEDVIFNIDYIGRCNMILISDKVIYNYNQIGESLTRSNKSDSEKDIIDALNAYILLQNEASKIYPEHGISINKDIYYRLYSLKKRAQNIQCNKCVNSIQDYMRENKKQLGKNYLVVKASIVFNNMKRNIKKTIIN